MGLEVDLFPSPLLSNFIYMLVLKLSHNILLLNLFPSQLLSNFIYKFVDMSSQWIEISMGFSTGIDMRGTENNLKRDISFFYMQLLLLLVSRKSRRYADINP